MRSWTSLVTGILIGALVAVSIISGTVRLPFVSGGSAAPTPIPTPRVLVIDFQKAKMVEKTIYSEMTYDIHLSMKTPSLSILGRTILEKEVLIMAAGSCQAGIDYETTPPVAQVTGTAASVKIADPRIFDCYVTSVNYFDGSGILPAPTELYNQLFAQARQEILAQAEKSDLQQKARENALKTVELNLRRLGFDQVSVDIIPAG